MIVLFITNGGFDPEGPLPFTNSSNNVVVEIFAPGRWSLVTDEHLQKADKVVAYFGGAIDRASNSEFVSFVKLVGDNPGKVIPATCTCSDTLKKKHFETGNIDFLGVLWSASCDGRMLAKRVFDYLCLHGKLPSPDDPRVFA